MTKVIGFTGTRKGMTDEQKKSCKEKVGEILGEFQCSSRGVVALHGDCVGADADFDDICRQLGAKDGTGFSTACRPCNFKNMRAYVCRAISEPIGPLERNRAIVYDATVMIACPPNKEEIKSGSGTWATIRFSRKVRKPLIIIYPDGEILEKNYKALEEPLTSNEQIARNMYGDRALSGPNALERSIKDWG